MKKRPENIKQEDWDSINSPSLSKKIINNMQPVNKTHPGIPARVRGSQVAPTKKQLTIRLNREVVDFFKMQGNGWQTKINDVLIDFINSHNVAGSGI